ncbi:MAG: GntP family permease [Planctomycetota bacterium]
MPLWAAQIAGFQTVGVPILILLVGIAIVLGLILFARLNAFLALLVAAIVVSLLAPGDPAQKIVRVAEAFGSTVGKIGIVIALAAVIGKCMMDSGAADRVVRFFVGALGERRAPEALAGASFVLAMPVFFDTVFYLMLPLARSLYRQTRRNYMLYVMAVVTGGVVTHCMVPPTPGPLAVAAELHVDLGMMILAGLLIGLPMAVVGLVYSRLINRLLPIPMRPQPGEGEYQPLPDEQLPGLVESLTPVVLPVVLIAAHSIVGILAERARVSQAAETEPAAVVASGGAPVEAIPPVPASPLPDAPTPREKLPIERVEEITAIVGNANLALLMAAAIAMFTLARTRGLTLRQMASATEEGLMSAGIIILITAAGGAFGAMLKHAGIDTAVQALFGGEGGSAGAFAVLLIGAVLSAIMKTAQGSSTVAMLTAAGMVSSMIAGLPELPFHPVYFATSIASAALVVSWMNDSGFWIVAKMGGLTETEALRSWTPLLALQGLTGVACSFLLAWLLPMAG